MECWAEITSTPPSCPHVFLASVPAPDTHGFVFCVFRRALSSVSMQRQRNTAMSRAAPRPCSILIATAVAASVVGTSSAFQATVTMSASGESPPGRVAGSTARAAQAATAVGVGAAAHDVAAKVAIDG